MQAFGKVGWETDKTDLDLSYTYADTNLWGNGATPQSMLNYLYESSYTPDYTANLMNFVNLTGTQFLAEKLLLVGQCLLSPPDHRQHQRQRQRQLSGQQRLRRSADRLRRAAGQRDGSSPTAFPDRTPPGAWYRAARVSACS